MFGWKENILPKEHIVQCRGDQVGIERVSKVVEEITKCGGTALFKQIDVTDKAQV